MSHRHIDSNLCYFYFSSHQFKLLVVQTHPLHIMSAATAAAPSSKKQISNEEIVHQFQKLRQEQRSIVQQLAKMDAEKSEHYTVIEALKLVSFCTLSMPKNLYFILLFQIYLFTIYITITGNSYTKLH